MEQFKTTRGEYSISTDRSKIDLDLIHEFLSKRSYWAVGRAKELVSKSIDHSICFGIYAKDGSQAGFARVVTDHSTFAWICDLFVLEPHRGHGLGKWLIKSIVEFPELRDLRRHLLATRDAHRLYREYGGFVPLQHPDRWLERVIENPSAKGLDQEAD